MSNLDKKYLQLRGNTYYARVIVPRTLRLILGTTHLRESLKTGDLSEANRRKHSVVALLKGRIAEDHATQKPDALKDLKLWRNALQEMYSKSDRASIEATQDYLENNLKQLTENTSEDLLIKTYRKIIEPKLLLSELIAQYLESKQLSIDSKRKSSVALNELLTLLDDDIPPEHITPQSLLKFKDYLSGSNLAPNTKRDRRGCLSQFWKWLESRLYVSKGSNPFSDLIIAGGNTEDVRAFKQSEIEKILKAEFLYEWRKDIFPILLLTGARPNEICSLKMKHVNLENQTFKIEGSKTEAGNRVLPYRHPTLVKIFTKYFIADTSQANKLLFPMEPSKSERQSKPYINFFSRLKKSLKLPEDISLYSARKSFNTTALDLDLDVVNIERYIGHKNARLALSTYSKGRSDKGLIEIAEKFTYPFTLE